jgi:hypothetical protein
VYIVVGVGKGCMIEEDGGGLMLDLIYNASERGHVGSYDVAFVVGVSLISAWMTTTTTGRQQQLEGKDEDEKQQHRVRRRLGACTIWAG